MSSNLAFEAVGTVRIDDEVVYLDTYPDEAALVV